MKYIISILLLLLKAAPAVAANRHYCPNVAQVADSLPEDTIYDIADVMPSFPGGTAALMQYLDANVVYPEEANGMQGWVIVSFVVGRDISISDVGQKKSVCPSLDNETIRVVTAMPKWIPGRQEGMPVRVRYNIPISFRLVR